jgi:hypothetical protein
MDLRREGTLHRSGGSDSRWCSGLALALDGHRVFSKKGHGLGRQG